MASDQGEAAGLRAEHQFEDLFADLHDLAYRVAFRILGVRTEAEDVAQEALARAYVRWSKVNHHPHPWVATVSSNLAIDTWRKRKRTPPADRLPALGTDTHATERVALARALGELPRRQREVVTLRYLADLPVADVARQLGCSTGAVKQHAWRGLASLRAVLEDPRPEDD